LHVIESSDAHESNGPNFQLACMVRQLDYEKHSPLSSTGIDQEIR
jgi:hypothetical protein